MLRKLLLDKGIVIVIIVEEVLMVVIIECGIYGCLEY